MWVEKYNNEEVGAKFVKVNVNDIFNDNVIDSIKPHGAPVVLVGSFN